jgi:hypothetical protein
VQPALKKRGRPAGSKNGEGKGRVKKPRLADVNADLMRQLEAASALIQQLQRPQPVPLATAESTGITGAFEGKDMDLSQRYVEMECLVDNSNAQDDFAVDPALLEWNQGASWVRSGW